jgi:hypothetical protein
MVRGRHIKGAFLAYKFYGFLYIFFYPDNKQAVFWVQLRIAFGNNE